MSDSDTLKREAAERAVTYIQSGMVVGLGTGSTAVFAVRRIGALLAAGELQGIVGIPTAEVTAREAERCGVPLGSLDDYPAVDITIDGADEIDPRLNLIKGLGGALLREKIVAAASRRLIIVADESKRVAQLATRAPVPVEVIPFARRPAADYLATLGARVVERQRDLDQFLGCLDGRVNLLLHLGVGVARALHHILQRPNTIQKAAATARALIFFWPQDHCLMS